MSIRWTEEEYENYLQSRNTLQVSKPKRSVRKEPAGKDRTKEATQGDSQSGGRCGIIVTAFCRRHTDPDNLCPKWYIDQLVRSGVIQDDSSKVVAFIRKAVVKIGAREKEKTVIEVVEAKIMGRKQFIYFEETDGGMCPSIVNSPAEIGLYGWMSQSCLDDDLALVDWTVTAEIGEWREHRLGYLVRIIDEKVVEDE